MIITQEGITYIWKQIFKRLDLSFTDKYFIVNGRKIGYSYGQSIDDQQDFDFTLNILKCDEKDIENIFNQDRIDWVLIKDIIGGGGNDFLFSKLPVLFWGNTTNKQFANINSRSLTIQVDLIATLFFFLTRYEEYLPHEKDRFGRFPYNTSVIKRFSLIDIPIVDIYILLLKKWIEKIISEQIVYLQQIKILLSHDIDFPYRNKPFGNYFKNVIKSMIHFKTRDFIHNTSQFFRSYEYDDYFSGLKQIIEISKKHEMASVFNLMATTHTKWDEGYDIHSNRLQKVINIIQENGFEIGLHPSFKSFEHPGLILQEKKLLESQISQPLKGGRQHYLRTKTPETWRYLSEAGLKYDNSYIFAEHEGFKCGTCFPYRVFDIHQNMEMNFTEIPLIVMDTTLKNYRHLTIAEAKQRIFHLADICKSVGGCFTMLWHNSSFVKSWWGWAQAYPSIIQGLSDLRK